LVSFKNDLKLSLPFRTNLRVKLDGNKNLIIE